MTIDPIAARPNTYTYWVGDYPPNYYYPKISDFPPSPAPTYTTEIETFEYDEEGRVVKRVITKTTYHGQSSTSNTTWITALPNTSK